MKILVTGSRGFLGTALCKKLEIKGFDIIRSNSNICNLTNSKSLQIYDDIKFDRIIHLAAWTQAGDFCLYHPGEQWVINQKINSNLLSWWVSNQPQAKLISIGTSCSYDPLLPLTEENYLKGTPIESLFTYAMCKRMMQIGKEALSKQFGLTYLTVVPSTLYGPGYHAEGKQMHFIFDLIRKFLEFKYKNKPIVLWGDGNQRRELVHVDDFVNNLLELDKLDKNQIYNIGAGEDYSIKEFAQILCEITGVNFSDIRFDRTKYVGALSKILDNTKLNNKFPLRSTTKLKKGLISVVDDFEKRFK